MKLKENKYTQLPSIQLEEKDLPEVYQIKEMLSGQYHCRKCETIFESGGWKILQGYFQSMRLWIEEKGKAHAETRIGREKCAVDFAKLAGFDHFRAVPDIVIKQFEALKNEQEKQEALKNEARRHDEY